jgi:hypothetical protein
MWPSCPLPPPELDAIVAKTLSELFRLPHGRIPAWVLANLKALGWSAQLVDIHAMNRAAMARAFARSEQLIDNLIGDRDRATDSVGSHFPLTALSRPRFGGWHSRLLISQLRTNLIEITSIHTFPTDNTIPKMQAYFHKILLPVIPDDHFVTLSTERLQAPLIRLPFVMDFAACAAGIFGIIRGVNR